ncbi:MAG: hypothetical protein ACOC9S_04800 [Planctomycetota bacterium]
MGDAKVSLRLGVALFTRRAVDSDDRLRDDADRNAGPTCHVAKGPKMTSSLPLAASWFAELSLPPAVLIALLGLINCFFGYVFFRVLLAFYGVTAGLAMGLQLVVWFRPEPATADYLVAGGAMAVLLGLLSWYVFRVAFAALAAVVVAVLLAGLFGEPPSVAGWIIGGIVGGLVGLAAFAQLGRMVVFFTAIAGGFAAVFVPAISYAGPEGVTSFGPLTGAILFLIAAGLSIAGYFAQSRLARVFDTGLTPRRRRSDRSSTALRPPFTRA